MKDMEIENAAQNQEFEYHKMNAEVPSRKHIAEFILKHRSESASRPNNN